MLVLSGQQNGRYLHISGQALVAVLQRAKATQVKGRPATAVRIGRVSIGVTPLLGLAKAVKNEPIAVRVYKTKTIPNVGTGPCLEVKWGDNGSSNHFRILSGAWTPKGEQYICLPIKLQDN